MTRNRTDSSQTSLAIDYVSPEKEEENISLYCLILTFLR